MGNLFEKRSLFKKSVFYKILFSLMSLTLLPIIFLGLISYFVFYRSVESRNVKYNRLILNTISEKIERDLDEIREIIFRYSLFLEIEHDNYGDVLNVVRELGGIAGTNHLIADIFVYYLDSDQVLTQKGVYDRATFFDEVYRYQGSAAQQIQGQLSQQNSFRILATRPVIRDGFMENNYVTILNSVPIQERPKAILIALIDEVYLESFIDTAEFESEDNRICIVNSDLELITGRISKNLDLKIFGEALANDTAGSPLDVHSFKVGKTAVYGTQSRVTDWHYLVFSPANQISKEAASIRYITLWISAVLTLICFLLAWAISLNIYTPIRDIVNAISDGSEKKQDQNPETDELSYIFSHMRYVTDRNKILDDSVKMSEPAFREHYLRSLILGIPDKMISSSESGHKLNWAYKKFSILVVETSINRTINSPDKPGISVADDLLRYLEEAINSPDGIVGFLTHIGKSRITILLNLQAENVLDQWLSEIATDIERYADKYQCTITFGVGDYCTAVSQINGSYEEALLALQSRKLHASSQIIRYSRKMAVMNLPKAVSYSAETERRLTFCVLAGDFEKVEQELNIVIADNVVGDITYNQLIALFERLVGTVGQIVEDNKGIQSKLENSDLFGRFREERPEGLDELRKQILDMYEQVTVASMKNRRDRSGELTERLIRYIEGNFDNPGISLDSIAEEFELNSKYVSRYFKEHTGTNYLDYLNKIRMDRARELLIGERAKKIKEISQLVGFYNVNTFISVFKKTEGVTPNAYRRMSVR